MTLMFALLAVIAILFVREEILSYACRKEIERAERVYALSCEKDGEAPLAALSCGGEERWDELPSFLPRNCQEDGFFDAA